MTKYMKIIMATIEANGGKASWGMIVEAIKAAGHNPKNWLTVRGHLQGLMNSKFIERTQDAHNEEYVSL